MVLLAYFQRKIHVHSVSILYTNLYYFDLIDRAKTVVFSLKILYLPSLITRRSLVQIQLPQPFIVKGFSQLLESFFSAKIGKSCKKVANFLNLNIFILRFCIKQIDMFYIIFYFNKIIYNIRTDFY